MNFALASHLSFMLAVLSGAQARTMRAIVGDVDRDLLSEEFDSISASSLSMSIPSSIDLDAAEADSSILSEEQAELLSMERFMQTPLGIAISEFQASTAANSSAATSDVAIETAHFDPFSKAAKIPWCENRLLIAKTKIDEKFGTTPSEVITNACKYYGSVNFATSPPTGNPYPYNPNKGCPVIAHKPWSFGFFTYGGFHLTYDGYKQHFYNNAQTASMYWNFVQYCDCYLGQDLDCAAKIPNALVHGKNSERVYTSHGPEAKKWADYCKFAAIWNGDSIGTTNTMDMLDQQFSGLSEEVQECGCFFIHELNTMVGNCPGVDLWAFESTTTNN